MAYGNVGSRMVRNSIALDQNDRADSTQEMREEDWRKDAPIRDANRVAAGDQLLARDADASSYGNEYNYALELKRRNDQERNMKLALAQTKMMKNAAQASKVSAPAADSAMIQYGVDGSDSSLSKVAQHTSGSGRPNGDGY